MIKINENTKNDIKVGSWVAIPLTLFECCFAPFTNDLYRNAFIVIGLYLITWTISICLLSIDD